MKKSFLAVVVAILLVIVGTSLLACNKPVQIAKLQIDSENLMEGARVVDILRERPMQDAESKAKEMKNASNILSDNDKCWTPAKNNNYASVEFELAGSKTFNTAVVSEVGVEVRYFRLQAYVDGNWKTLQVSEKMGEQRIVSFDTVTSSRLRLSIEKFHGEKKYASIKNIKLYNLQSNRVDNFNVTVYQRIDIVKPSEILAKGEEYAKTYARYYDVYNTVIVFDAVTWDSNGNLIYKNDGVDGLTGKQYFDRENDALK